MINPGHVTMLRHALEAGKTVAIMGRLKIYVVALQGNFCSVRYEDYKTQGKSATYFICDDLQEASK